MGDIDGDGDADLCGRSNSDFICALSNGSDFETYTVWRAALSDASGWNAAEHYTTLRLADVDGDGREDLCARDGAGFGCWISDGTTFARRVEGPRWSNDTGFTAARYYGTLRMGDVDGDGSSDVCIRAGDGMRCALSDGSGFPTTIVGPAWGDAQGFHAIQYWSTLRMGDVNGDGLHDLCIRTSTDYRCHMSTGTGFGDAVIVGALTDASGWDDPANYRTLRLGDVDGDGAEDICARANAEVRCWVWDGAAFAQRSGPLWSDATGWAATPAYYDTMRLADLDGDGRDDLCARSGAGWTCSLARGDTFGETVDTGEFSDAGGWQTSPSFWSTILMGGRCRVSPETCNGVDDDCDQRVDEDVCVDASVPIPVDGSVPIPVDAGATTRPPGSISSGCACHAGADQRGPSGAAWLVFVTLVLAAHTRRRRAMGRHSRPVHVNVVRACATPRG